MSSRSRDVLEGSKEVRFLKCKLTVIAPNVLQYDLWSELVSAFVLSKIEKSVVRETIPTWGIDDQELESGKKEAERLSKNFTKPRINQRVSLGKSQEVREIGSGFIYVTVKIRNVLYHHGEVFINIWLFLLCGIYLLTRFRYQDGTHVNDRMTEFSCP